MSEDDMKHDKPVRAKVSQRYASKNPWIKKKEPKVDNPLIWGARAAKQQYVLMKRKRRQKVQESEVPANACAGVEGLGNDVPAKPKRNGKRKLRDIISGF